MSPRQIRKAIASSGLTIYDLLTDHPEFFIETRDLERLLNKALVGLNLDYAIRTRPKVLKSRVCEALGYPVPKSFKRCQPRFPGQNFDTYVQKADNLQIWNEDVLPTRRYVLIRVDDKHLVTRVRVVTGDVIARLDTTGTLTHKYQARSRREVTRSVLVSEEDTDRFTRTAKPGPGGRVATPTPISEVFERLKGLVGKTLPNPGSDQERNRG